jgi:hypothetical protein
MVRSRMNAISLFVESWVVGSVNEKGLCHCAEGVADQALNHSLRCHAEIAHLRGRN